MLLESITVVQHKPTYLKFCLAICRLIKEMVHGSRSENMVTRIGIDGN